MKPESPVETAPERLPGLISELKALAPGGFALGLHVRFTTPTYMFQTYPEPWLAEYSRDGLLMRDPVVGWCFANRGAVPWSSLEDPGGVLARAAAHGMTHGVAVSFEDAGSVSMAGFARGGREFTPAEAARIEAVMRELHALTATAQPLGNPAREALRRLSVAFTHP